MIRVTLGNSVCSITGLDEKQWKELRTLLSFTISAQASFFSGNFRGNVRYLLDKRGDFPTGLWYLVSDWLAKLPTPRAPHLIEDKRVRPTSATKIFTLNLE